MEKAADKLLYEKAAYLKEQIIALRDLQKQQVIVDNNDLDIDVIGVAHINNNICVHVLSIRGGHILGSRQFFPKVLSYINANNLTNILENFIIQYYNNNNFINQWPKELVVSKELANKDLLIQAIDKLNKKNIKINYYSRGDKAKWIQIAEKSAMETLYSTIKKENNLQQMFVALAKSINIQGKLKKIECFDISHMQGDCAIGACVVFSLNGAVKEEYRKYNINTAKKGDDYQALAEAIERRYSKLLELNKQLPDLIIIDGGKGQLTVAEKILRKKT